MIAPTLTSPTATPTTLAQSAPSQADYERKQAMTRAWKAYRGELADPLKVKAGQPNDNVKSNRCSPIVEKGVSFLFGQILPIQAHSEIGDDESKDVKNDKQDFLDDLWGDDDCRMTLLSQLAMNGGVCGQAFFKVVPRKEMGKPPRIVLLDPLLLRVVTADDDCTAVLAYVIEYPGPADWQKRQIIARIDPNADLLTAGDDPDDTWTITNYLRRGSIGSWAQIGEVDAWPYPFAPIFECQNLPNPNEWWGRPDLTSDLIAMNEILNFIQSNTARIIKYHAHPKTYAIGVKASQIDTSVDEVICLPSPDSKLANLEMAHNLADSINFASILRSDMDEQSRVPGVALGRLTDLPRGNISGVALELLFQPLIEKTIQKQRLYGEMIRQLSRAALCMAGYLSIETYETYEIDLPWQNLLPADDLLAAQRAVLLLQIGTSKETLLTQLGFDPETEAENIAEEAQAQAEAQAKRAALLPPAQPVAVATTGAGKPVPPGAGKPLPPGSAKGPQANDAQSAMMAQGGGQM